MTANRLARARHAEAARRRKAIVNVARMYERCRATRQSLARAAFDARRQGNKIAPHVEQYHALGPDLQRMLDQLTRQIAVSFDDNRALVDGILYLVPSGGSLIRVTLAELEDWGHRKVAITKSTPPTENGGFQTPGGTEP